MAGPENRDDTVDQWIEKAKPSLRLLLLAGTVSGAVLAGIGIFAMTTRGEDTMGRTTTDAAMRVRVPPIDAAAPATVETATFALG